MNDARPRILIAAPLAVCRELGHALMDHVDIIAAETLEEAIAAAQDCPRLILVCYAFDEMRPFRLLHQLRGEQSGPRCPIVLVRALPISFGAVQEAEVRESYKTLGVEEFFNLHEEKRRHGRDAALNAFRNSV